MNKKTEMLPKLTVDRELSVAYIRYRDTKVEERIILDDEDTLIADIDGNGDIVGIEIVSLLRLARIVREMEGSRKRKSGSTRNASATISSRPLNESEIPMYVIPFVFGKESRLATHA